MSGYMAGRPEAEGLPERRFGWSDIFVSPAKDPRGRAPLVGERATLMDFLRGQRQTLGLKCEDLTVEQMARRAVPPSNMSLLGLIRHIADVERYWFRHVLGGEDDSRRYRTPEDHDHDFNGAIADAGCVDEAWAAWREETAYAEQCVEGFAELGTTVLTPRGNQMAVREVLVRMIEEYARHCGHADLLRERIDGRVGQ